MYSKDFKVRLVQAGTATEAFTWQPEHFPELTRAAVTTRPWAGHNSTFDQLALERSCGIPFSATAAFAIDTGIFSRLLDPREKRRGGIGNTLGELVTHYLGLDEKHTSQKALLDAGRTHGLTKDTLWENIPADDPTYLTYAGLDVLQTARLAPVLMTKLKQRGLGWLADWEHRLAYVLTHMTRRGTLLDVPYAEQAKTEFLEQYEQHEARLAELGITPTASGRRNSAKAALLKRFEQLGVTFTKRTKTGQVALDDDVMQKIAARDDEAADLARTVLAAKKAWHYGDGYLGGFLAAVGHDGRVHPTINPLAAATGRMSITNPPLQQVPKDEKALRGAFIADPGEVIVSVDFDAVEARVAAAVTRDPTLTKEILAGTDVHAETARQIFGDGFTKEQRDAAKIMFFGGFLYGGGAETVARQAGIPLEIAQPVRARLKKRFPKVQATMDAFTEKLGDRGGSFVTPTGRHLITDRGYRTLNYMVQGPARDICADAALRMANAGLTDMLRLVVHDEYVLSVPKDQLGDVLPAINDCMNMEFRGIPITASAEVLGERWKK